MKKFIVISLFFISFTSWAQRSNYPDRMGPVEYRQRGRSQSFRALEGVKADTDEQKELNGLLINSKLAVGETAYFLFTRTDIKENFHRLAIPVKPNTEKEIKLPMGTYYVEISCGSTSNTKGAIVHVDPRQTTQAGKKEQTVYFWAEKCLSNY